MSPEGKTRIDSANLDTVTARNVSLEARGSRQGQHERPSDINEGGYVGMFNISTF